MWPLTKKTQKKSKKTSKQRGKKEALSLIRRRRLNIFFRAMSVTMVCVALVGSAYIWKSGLFQAWVMETRDAVDQEISDAGFAVKDVRVTGQENTPLKQVTTALALYDGQSIVSVDLEGMLTRVEALPWVSHATISRIMPDVLNVTIREHDAAAVWQTGGKLYLVTDSGEIITDRGLEKFGHLPLVVGLGANENLTSLLAMKHKYPDLFADVKSAVWVGRRRWDLNLHNGIKIKLPEKGPELAWDHLYDYQSKQKILNKEILSVDLRQHGKTILRLTKKEAERRRLMNKNGSKEENI